MRISIYGSNEARHRETTKSTINLSRIHQNIAGLKSFRDNGGYGSPFIYVKMIESGTPDENTEFIQIFADAGDQAFLEPAMNWNDPSEGNLSQLTPEEIKQSNYFSNRKKACPFPFYTLVIHSDLKVSACCVDWNKQVVVGDLRNQSIKEIWHGKQLRQLQITHLEKRRNELSGCKDCTYIHTAPDNIDSLSPEVFISRTR